MSAIRLGAMGWTTEALANTTSANIAKCCPASFLLFKNSIAWLGRLLPNELGRRFRVFTNIVSRKFLAKRDILHLKRTLVRSSTKPDCWKLVDPKQIVFKDKKGIGRLKLVEGI